MQKWDRSQRLSASGKALASDAEYMPIDGCQRINEFMGWWAFKKAEPGSRHFARIGLTQDEENELVRWCCKHNSDELEVVWNDAILTEQNKLADGEILKKKR